jgi:diacylglycerol kinase (ATP)
VRVMVIVNPISGRGAAPEASERLGEALRERGHRVERRVTRARGDAGRFAAEADRGFDRIVVAGGDGTLNEVLNGLPDPTRVPVAHLALGTANMLARDLALPRDPRGVAALLENGIVRRIDLGRIGKQRFLGNVGVGFDALVVERIGRMRRGALGYRSYLIPIARSLVSYRPPRLQARIDGGAPHACGFVIVSNLRNYGGLFRISDRARCDSGAFEVCLFERARVRDLLRGALAGFRGRIERQPGVLTCAARRIRVDGEAAPVQVDGDSWGTTPIELEIEPAAASILAPKRD